MTVGFADRDRGAVPTGASAATPRLLPEVQALRAVAVMLVILYHLWPGVVPAGYLGVDVFFVISGFLITGQIVRDLDRGRFGLGRFYLRRARRLLPAAMTVLAVIAVTTVLVVPYSRWVETARQILGSTFYVQNWVLVSQKTDYLTPVVRPTPVQHFWSLSVEEQFYLVWPLLLLLAVLLAARLAPGRAEPRRLLPLGAMVAVTACSFLYGLRVTATDPDSAYFLSTARAWEFGAGGLLVLLLRRTEARRRLRALLSWAALAAIGVAALTFDAGTPFPGWAAAVPVLGAVGFIAAGTSGSRWSPDPLVRLGPVQFVGDLSYSMYLWHWPLLLLWPYLTGSRVETPDRILVLVLTVGLAWASKVLVEDRFRAHSPLRGTAATVDPGMTATAAPGTAAPVARGRRALVSPLPTFLAVTLLVTVTTASGAWWAVQRRVTAANLVEAAALAELTDCFGADAMAPGRDCAPPFGSAVTPDPAVARERLSATQQWEECMPKVRARKVVRCDYGPKDADVHVVLFGDSHAIQWFPAIHRITETHGWRLSTYLRSSCTPSLATMLKPDEEEQGRCHKWATTAIRKIAADRSVDLVVTSAMNNKKWVKEGDLDRYESGVKGYRATWRKLARSTRRSVLVLRDTPRPIPDVVDCLSSRKAVHECTRSRKAAMSTDELWGKRTDPMVEAVKAADHPRVRLADLTSVFCAEKSCSPVIGNVLVYADGNHLTTTYAHTLTPYLERHVLVSLGASAATPLPVPSVD
ncbi:MAG: acyltransferase [Actinomycetales bacterium]|nr:acyltransferase [Actinomycetales bacterium]